MEFKHYIFTRYNIDLYGTNPYKIKDKDAWMEDRLNHFYYYLAGLESQTNPNFTALVAVDPKTPQEYINQIVDAITSSVCNIKLIFEMPQDWLRRQPISHGWLITSRLDNDDMYKPEFVEQIQKNFKKERLVYDIVTERVKGDRVERTERRHNNSSFTTLIEPYNEGFKTIFTGKGHTYLPRYFKCVRLPYKEPLAVCNVHGMNAYYK